MILSIAWRNIWRNKKRSLVVIVAVALGMIAGIISIGFMNGMVDQRVNAIIQMEISHMQLHNSKFAENNDLEFFIPDAFAKADQIRKQAHVQGVSPRIIIHSMVATAELSTGVKIVGLMPEQEMKTGSLHTRIIDGSYFNKKRNPVVIGKKLSEKLHVKVGNKVIITLRDASNNIVSGSFRVSGVFKTNNTGFDESAVYVKYDDLNALAALPEGAAHEIAVLTDNNAQADTVFANVKKQFPSLEVKTWKEISPEGAYLADAMNQYNYVFIIIILLALLFAIINTMLMVVLERTKELGMLMAIGMNRLRVFMMMMLETVLLTFTGGLTGIAIGYGLVLYYGVYGINFSSMSDALEDFGYSSYVFTSIEVSTLFIIAIMVIITGIIAAIYPAIKALKLNPANAVRSE